MAGPITDEERRSASRRLGAGFVALVALSTGLVAMYSGGTVAEIGLVAAAGIGAGLAILVAMGVWP